MSDIEFVRNKVEELIQLLSVNNELLDKQNVLIEQFLNRAANLEAERELKAFVHNANKQPQKAAG